LKKVRKFLKESEATVSRENTDRGGLFVKQKVGKDLTLSLSSTESRGFLNSNSDIIG
jgi:hypothetical protein